MLRPAPEGSPASSAALRKPDFGAAYTFVSSGTGIAASLAETAVSVVGTGATALIWPILSFPSTASSSVFSWPVRTSVEHTWAELIARQQQAKKNKPAMSLLTNWLAEAAKPDEAETKDLKAMQETLDSARGSTRKLFP